MFLTLSKESFLQAAGRHLYDATVLLDNGRYDNTVYLTGYSIECILKEILTYHNIQSKAIRQYQHDLELLHSATTDKLQLLFPQLNHFFRTPIDDLIFIAEGHPEKRYWKSSVYTEEIARKSVDVSKEIYQSTVSSLLLDGKITLEDL